MNTLNCENLTKIYGKKAVVQDVTLTLEPGKIYGLVGRNGAGKTTLLSMLAAQNPASAGTVSCNGMSVWENAAALSHICFSRELSAVGDKNGIGSWRVKDYLRAARTYLPHWDREKEKTLLNKLGLELGKRLLTLSAGMRSSLTILVGMCSGADFTMLDEPAAGLDVIARQEFYRLLLEEREESGRMFLISTHILGEAADAFDEVIFLKDGKLLKKVNTAELLERCVHVSGTSAAVDRLCEGHEVYGKQSFGSGCGATILLKPGEAVPAAAELSVRTMSLEEIFAALCGEEQA